MPTASEMYDQLLQVRVPDNLPAQAKAKSNETGTTLSHVVRKALERWVKEKP